MANGGIIGPVNTVSAGGCAPAQATTFTASGTFTAAATASVDYLVIAGGGGGDYASAPATYHGGAGGLGAVDDAWRTPLRFQLRRLHIAGSDLLRLGRRP